MTIFEALREDHDHQRDLLDQLVATEGDSERRDDLLRRTKAALLNHELAEERCFYVPLMESDLTHDKARHSVAEHHEIDELIETLETKDYSSPGWLHEAKKLRELVLHHLDEEEQQVFQLAGKALSEQRKEALATQYRNAMHAQNDENHP